MSSFLLVHGSWHGSWCWERLRPELEALQHTVVAIDLPGHGADETPPWKVTHRSYSKAIVAAAESLSEPPIVVGHSVGGLAAASAVAKRPEVFSSLIYLCAFIPLGVAKLVGLRRKHPAEFLDEAFFRQGTSMSIGAEDARRVLYERCAEEDASWAAGRLRPSPLRPLVGLMKRREISVPTAYIECTSDHAIPVDLQRAMASAAKISMVSTLDADHSPFLCRPRELAAALNQIGKSLSAAV